MDNTTYAHYKSKGILPRQPYHTWLSRSYGVKYASKFNFGFKAFVLFPVQIRCVVSKILKTSIALVDYCVKKH